MTTVLSQEGQIVLPGSVRQRLDLHAGDDFEVFVEDDDSITLRRISQPANHGLVDLLLACPVPFDIPARDRDENRAVVGLESFC
jgi:AbrB family looped-hinge helix DNA binding protein